MDPRGSLDLAIHNALSIAVVIAGFIYCVYFNTWALPRKIISRWYRISLGSLALGIWGVATVIILILFGGEAVAARHPNVARVIERVVVIALYCDALSLVVSIVSLFGGVIMGIKRSEKAN